MIGRDALRAAGRQHDLIIVGGGIYGACLALEAARRGLRPLLLERGDFGEATSWSSFRLLHGGFRYLQRLGVGRLRESVQERRWFLRTFPELTRPQECLMPLYGEGLKRPLLVRAALLANDLLSCDRNTGVDAARHLPGGRLLDAAETVSRFPVVDRAGLRGAAVWYDATMVSSQRVLIEILHWACSLGATALNYVEATGLVTRGGAVVGIKARDTLRGRPYTFWSRVVCNCAGPWSGELAARFDRPVAQLFRPSLAFNVLLDCEPPCASAVAVAARRPGTAAGPVYFLYPALGRLFAGTAHAPWTEHLTRPEPTEEHVRQFLDDLNAAVPGLGLRPAQIVRVFAGLLPVTQAGTANLSVRAIVRDHGRYRGPSGLVSVSGVKFTTARRVAERTLKALGPYLGRLHVRRDADRPPRQLTGINVDEPGGLAPGGDEIVDLRRLVAEEAVMTVDDLLLRRTNWGITARDPEALRRRVRDAIGRWPDGAGLDVDRQTRVEVTA